MLPMILCGGNAFLCCPGVPSVRRDSSSGVIVRLLCARNGNAALTSATIRHARIRLWVFMMSPPEGGPHSMARVETFSTANDAGEESKSGQHLRIREIRVPAAWIRENEHTRALEP